MKLQRAVGIALILGSSLYIIILRWNNLSPFTRRSLGRKYVKLGENIRLGRQNMTEFWSSVHGLVNGDFLYPKDFDVTSVIKALRHGRIVGADMFWFDTSVKWLLTLEGGQRAVFKIKTQEKLNELNTCNTGCEHPEYEVVGFTLNRMFDLRNMPFVSGRTISWFDEIYPVATSELRKFMQVEKNNRVCFDWICWETNENSRFCYENGEITGAMIYYIEGYEIVAVPSRKSMHHSFHIYGINDERNLERLPGDKTFCNRMRRAKPYDQDTWFLDIIDMSIIDYIMSHDDSKHTLIVSEKELLREEKLIKDKQRRIKENLVFINNKTTFKGNRLKFIGGKPSFMKDMENLERENGQQKGGRFVVPRGTKMYTDEMRNLSGPVLNIMFDYGAAFCEFEHLKILAPLLQCCRLRTRLYDAMLRQREHFADTFLSMTEDDPLHPLLSPKLQDDMIQKFEQSVAFIKLCIKLDSEANVLIDI